MWAEEWLQSQRELGSCIGVADCWGKLAEQSLRQCLPQGDVFSESRSATENNKFSPDPGGGGEVPSRWRYEKHRWCPCP